LVYSPICPTVSQGWPFYPIQKARDKWSLERSKVFDAWQKTGMVPFNCYKVLKPIMSRFGNLEFGDQPEKTAEQQPLVKDAAYYVGQAEREFERGRFEKALRFYSKVLEFDPRNPQAWLGQVRMLIEFGEFSEARLWADKAIEIYPDDPELLAAKAVALARAGDLKGAISFSDASIESRGNTPYIWLARADVLLACHEKRAEYCFEKALTLAGPKWVWRWLAARIQAFYQHFARALALVQEAVSLNPGEAVLWLEIGRCQLALGMPAQAQRSLEQARELDPESHLADKLLNEAENTSVFRRMGERCRKFFGK
jgi:tetratricopeptide (TPR) repeat protein